MAEGDPALALVDVTALPSVSLVTFLALTGEPARGVEAQGVLVAVVAFRGALVHVGAIAAIAGVPRATGALEAASGVDTSRHPVAVVGPVRTFVHVHTASIHGHQARRAIATIVTVRVDAHRLGVAVVQG